MRHAATRRRPRPLRPARPTGTTPAREAPPVRTGAPVVLLVGILVAAVVVGAVAVVASVDEPAERYPDVAPVAATPSDPLLAEPATPPGLRMLRSFDAARARAWADGDLDDLAALYAPGSAAQERDVAALASYVERGLVVEDLTTQVLRADLRRADRRTRVMAVTDQVVGGLVVGDEVRPTALPGDQPTDHLLTWRRVDGEWLLAEVEPV